MTDIEQKALALVNEVQEFDCGVSIYHVHNAKLLRQALCRAIEQHEAFKQEVSDAVEAVLDRYYVLNIEDMLSHLIISKPKPDPLVEVLKDFGGFMPDAEDFRAALESRGLEIREKSK